MPTVETSTTPDFKKNTRLLIKIQNQLQAPINAYLIMAIVALFLTLTANISFFTQVLQVYPLSDNLVFVM